jgi:hypothetical protein
MHYAGNNNYFFFFLYIFRVFYVYVPLPPLRGQHTVLCHPKWLPTLGLTEFAVCWGEAGFEPRTTDLQSGALPLSHLSSYAVSIHYRQHSLRTRYSTLHSSIQHIGCIHYTGSIHHTDSLHYVLITPHYTVQSSIQAAFNTQAVVIT